MAMNWVSLLVRNVAEIVHGIANDVHHPAKRAFSDGHGNRTAGVRSFHTSHHAVCGKH